MAQKFIIQSGKFIHGNVDTHSQLGTTRDWNNIAGGGMWFYDPLQNDLYLYGASTEFGHVTEEQVMKAEYPPSLRLANKIFNPFAIKLDQALASKIVKK